MPYLSARGVFTTRRYTNSRLPFTLPGPSTGAADPIFPGKKTGDLFSHYRPCAVLQLAIFFAHHSLVSLRGRPLFRHAKICRSYCGGPCSAEHAEHAQIRRCVSIRAGKNHRFLEIFFRFLGFRFFSFLVFLKF